MARSSSTNKGKDQWLLNADKPSRKMAAEGLKIANLGKCLSLKLKIVLEGSKTGQETRKPAKRGRAIVWKIHNT